ncbi:MAG: glycosyltransferase family 4 protein, partial [Cyanobacteria bacterium P01_A01_bin.83]
MKVLISAYSCQPNCGSEAGNGWNWAWHLAELGHEVWVLTLIDNQKTIESELISHPTPNLHFIYIAIPQWIKRYIKISIGDFDWQSEYLGWQQKAGKIARQLDREHGFDIIHHVTWASITGGSWLWRLNKPFVFGPVGGGQVAPPLFKQYFLAHQWRKEALRSFIFQKLAQFNLFSRQTVSQADLVLATNSETYNLARQLGANRVELAAVIGIAQNYIPLELPIRSTAQELRLLWVGSPIPTKACPLALEALAKVDSQVPWKLTVVGFSNSNHDLIKLIKKLGIEDQVNCKGRISWGQLKQEYLQNDVFLFTSLRNSLGAQLFEAMACGLPIITLDHQGAKDFVPEGAGIKVPVTNPTETTNLLAQAVEDLYHNPQKRGSMSKFGYEFAKTQTWSHKAQKMSKYYEELVTS